jgi:hypothetical protein
VLDGILPGLPGKLFSAAVPAGAGALLYFVMTAVLRVSEAKTAAGFVKRLKRRS